MALDCDSGNLGFTERTRTLWNGLVARVKLMDSSCEAWMTVSSALIMRGVFKGCTATLTPLFPANYLESKRG